MATDSDTPDQGPPESPPTDEPAAVPIEVDPAWLDSEFKGGESADGETREKN
jgi:hypothetical protein